jgi:hypothetical protein
MITVAVIWFGIGEASKSLPDHLHDDLHRDPEHRGRRLGDRAQQDPRGRVARGEPGADLLSRGAAGDGAVHSSPGCGWRWPTPSRRSWRPS